MSDTRRQAHIVNLVNKTRIPFFFIRPRIDKGPLKHNWAQAGPHQEVEKRSI